MTSVLTNAVTHRPWEKILHQELRTGCSTCAEDDNVLAPWHLGYAPMVSSEGWWAFWHRQEGNDQHQEPDDNRNAPV